MPHTDFTTLASAPVFTSVLTVQGTKRTNVTIAVGSLSAGSAVNLGGAFVGTVTIQRSFNNGTTWHDVNNWAVATEAISDKPEPETVQYRLGTKTGDFTSGEAVVRLGTT